MFNRNEMRAAKKVVLLIINNTKAVRATLDGVVQDIDSGMWGDAEMMIPIGPEGTVGAIRARQDWKTDPFVIDHMIASVQGRMIQHALVEFAGLSPLNASISQMAELLLATDNQQRSILVDVVGKEKAEAHWKAADDELAAMMKEHDSQQGSVKF